MQKFKNLKKLWAIKVALAWGPLVAIKILTIFFTTVVAKIETKITYYFT